MVKSNSSSGLGGPGLVIALLAGVGILSVTDPIDRGQAESSELLPLALDGSERIAARLWEDPVHAVGRTIRRGGTSDEIVGLIDLTKDGSQDSGEGGGLQLDESWLVLTVFTHSGNEPEIQEKRRRTRYAMQAAFAVEGYVPTSGKHLGAFRFIPADHTLCRPTAARAKGSADRHQFGMQAALSVGPGGPVFEQQLGAFGLVPSDHTQSGATVGRGLAHADRHLFPFERFTRPARDNEQNTSTLPAQNVLLLWVPEDELGSRALSVTHSLLESLIEQQSDADAKGPSFAFIGPTSTGRLLEFVKSDVTCGHSDETSAACPLRGSALISSWATAKKTGIEELLALPQVVKVEPTTDSDEQAGEGDTGSSTGASRFADPEQGIKLTQSGLRIERGIGTDDTLVRMLVEDLVLRGIKEGDSVALLGEFGSTYSAAFLQAYSAVGGENQAGEKPATVHSYAYPLGLDGSVPGEPDQRSKEGLQQDTDPERAVGRSQVDYVRRLQQQLHGGDYKAIGIVGTSVSDKLMLLRALRREFPHAILFTSDIDARYLQRSEYKYVRNLLVGSHFGLEPELEPELEGTPVTRPLPFRDGYQTANFYAVRDHLKAFGDPQPPQPIEDETPDSLETPRVLIYQRVLAQAGGWWDLFAAEPEPTPDGEGAITPDAPAGDPQPENRGNAQATVQAEATGPAQGTEARARLYEVGRTGFVELPRTDMPGSSPRLFGLAFPLLGVLGAYVLARMGRVRRSLLAGKRPLLPITRARLGWLFLLVLLLAIVATTLASAEVFWFESGWEDMRKISALGITLAFLLVVHCLLAWGSDERRRRSAIVRITAVSIPIAALVFLLAGIAITLLREPGSGEPLAILEGVNVWPTIAARIVVIICSIAAFFHLERFLRRGEREVRRSFDMGQRKGRAGKQKTKMPAAHGLFMVPPRRDPSRSLSQARLWYETYSKQRVWRSSMFTLLFAVFLLFAFMLDRHDFAHARGRVAMEFERWSWGLSLVGIAWLIFLVADSTQLCRQLILPFCDRRPLMYWQNKDLAPIAGVMPAIVAERAAQAGEQGPRRMFPANLHPLMIMRYITMVTERVSRLSWYPFTLLFVLILAQNGYVENWAWSWASAGLFAFCIVGVLAATVMLRTSAERLRTFLLVDLREDMLCYKLRNDREKLDEIEQAIEEIEETREGAFRPLREHPIVTAVLLPFGGAGTIALLEFMNR